VVSFERIHPETRDEWRRWLAQHHATSPGVWLVQWRTVTGRRRLSYDEIVEEALCFGWIDGRINPLDDERSMLMMTPRKPNGTWAATNKARVERLIADGSMTAAGLRVIATAKANGAWTILDDVDAMIIPDDLDLAFAGEPTARANFDRFPPSARKQALYWVKSAKRPETRARRVGEVVRLAALDIRAPQTGRTGPA
jgi:uncharacterized protein YdeI (YjbR/CyaY-like superfamily)